jgi:integrase
LNIKRFELRLPVLKVKKLAVLTMEECLEIFDSRQPKHKLLLLLCYGQDRVSEIVTLNGEILFSEHKIHIKMPKARKTVWLCCRILSLIRWRCTRSCTNLINTFWRQYAGEPYSVGSAQQVMRVIIYQRKRPYILYDTVFTHLLERHWYSYIQKICGHAIKTTTIYTHVSKWLRTKNLCPLDRLVDENNKKNLVTYKTSKDIYLMYYKTSCKAILNQTLLNRIIKLTWRKENHSLLVFVCVYLQF